MRTFALEKHESTMENVHIDIEKIQAKVTQCIKSDCPSAEVCIRQIVRRGCDKSLEHIKIVNPDAIVMEDGKCQFFRDTSMVAYGVGFTHYFELLTYKEAQIALAVLRNYFHSSAQLSRYRTGKIRVSPEMKAEIDRFLQREGVTTPLQCDEYVTDFR